MSTRYSLFLTKNKRQIDVNDNYNCFVPTQDLLFEKCVGLRKFNKALVILELGADINTEGITALFNDAHRYCDTTLATFLVDNGYNVPHELLNPVVSELSEEGWAPGPKYGGSDGSGALFEATVKEHAEDRNIALK